jgi:hypothetical protein
MRDELVPDRHNGIEAVTSFFSRRCTELGFRPLEMGADRHGGWEWTGTKTSEDLVEYLVLAVLEGRRRRTSTTCLLEIWRGLDDGTRFARSRIARGRVRSWSLVADSAGNLFSESARPIGEQLGRGFLNTAQYHGAYWSAPEKPPSV